MPSFEVIGRWLLVIGIIIVIIGALLWAAGRILPAGKDLPGTIRIEGTGFTCLIPLLASIVLSVVLTIVLNLLGRFLNK